MQCQLSNITVPHIFGKSQSISNYVESTGNSITSPYYSNHFQKYEVHCNPAALHQESIRTCILLIYNLHSHGVSVFLQSCHLYRGNKCLMFNYIDLLFILQLRHTVSLFYQYATLMQKNKQNIKDILSPL